MNNWVWQLFIVKQTWSKIMRSLSDLVGSWKFLASLYYIWILQRVSCFNWLLHKPRFLAFFFCTCNTLCTAILNAALIASNVFFSCAFCLTAFCIDYYVTISKLPDIVSSYFLWTSIFQTERVTWTDMQKKGPIWNTDIYLEKRGGVKLQGWVIHRTLSPDGGAGCSHEMRLGWGFCKSCSVTPAHIPSVWC